MVEEGAVAGEVVMVVPEVVILEEAEFMEGIITAVVEGVITVVEGTITVVVGAVITVVVEVAMVVGIRTTFSVLLGNNFTWRDQGIK